MDGGATWPDGAKRIEELTYNPRMSWETFQKQVADLTTTPERWELLGAPGPEYWAEGASPSQSYVMLLVSSDGPVVSAQALEDPPTAHVLSVFATMSCLAPSFGEPRRPATLITADESLVPELTARLHAVGVTVEYGATPNAVAAYESMMAYVTAPTVADSLTHTDDDAVRAYFRAAEEFYRSRPWEALAEEKFVGFRSEGQPWRYASVMGHGGEEYGLAVYDNWLDACRMAYAHMPTFGGLWTDEPPDPLVAIDGLEGVSLYPTDMITEGDAAVIARLRLRKTWNGQYALVQRHEFEGAVPALNELETYTAVMQVLTARVDRARGRAVTSIKAQVDTVYGTVEVVYPAKGTEDASSSLYYQVEFTHRLFRRGGIGPFECLARAVVPAAKKWPKLISAVRAAAREAGYRDTYLDNLTEPGELVTLWFGNGSAVEPSPTVEQLADLDSVCIGLGNHLHPVSIKRVPPPAEPGISAGWTELAVDKRLN